MEPYATLCESFLPNERTAGAFPSDETISEAVGHLALFGINRTAPGVPHVLFPVPVLPFDGLFCQQSMDTQRTVASSYNLNIFNTFAELQYKMGETPTVETLMRHLRFSLE